MADNWFAALGHPVPPWGQQEAVNLLASNGCDSAESAMVIQVVAREMHHDNPDRAQSMLRSFLPPRGSEILLVRVLSVLGSAVVTA